MLTVEEAIRQRRSVRSFKNVPVPREMLVKMLEAARLAPSGTNLQPWRIIVVESQQEKTKLCEYCFKQPFIEEAGAVFVVCADPAVFLSQNEYKRVGTESVLTDPRYKDLVKARIEKGDRLPAIMAATENTYIAVEHIVLMATALGLGSCWVGGISNHKGIMNLLNIPQTYWIASLVTVGYTDFKPPQQRRHSLDEILIRPLGG